MTYNITQRKRCAFNTGDSCVMKPVLSGFQIRVPEDMCLYSSLQGKKWSPFSDTFNIRAIKYFYTAHIHNYKRNF